MPRIKQSKVITVFLNATFKNASQEAGFRQSLGEVIEAFTRVYKVSGTDISSFISTPSYESVEAKKE